MGKQKHIYFKIYKEIYIIIWLLNVSGEYQVWSSLVDVII